MNRIRPLTSRALTSAIDSLRPYLSGAKVIDLYAGLGRFGQKALNEAAVKVVFVEKDWKLTQIIGTKTESSSSRRKIVCSDVMEFLEIAHKQQEKFDVVFADPPFGQWTGSFADSLYTAVSRVLAKGAIFLVKCPKRMVPSATISSFSFWKAANFGDSKLLYFRHGEAKALDRT